MFGSVPVTRDKWIYLPWKWAVRFGHDGWIKPELSWLLEFRNGLPDERKEREQSRVREAHTRATMAYFYRELNREGTYPTGLPLSPDEVYRQAIEVSDNTQSA